MSIATESTKLAAEAPAEPSKSPGETATSEGGFAEDKQASLPSDSDTADKVAADKGTTRRKTRAR
jgi:hypothetical protein